MDSNRSARRSALSPLHANTLPPSPLGSSTKPGALSGTTKAAPRSRFHPSADVKARAEGTRLPSPPLRGACENTPPARVAAALSGSKLPRPQPRQPSPLPAANAGGTPDRALLAMLASPKPPGGLDGYQAFTNPSFDSLDDFFASPVPGAGAPAPPLPAADSPLAAVLGPEDSAGSAAGATSASRLPTPEAWQVLRSINHQEPGLNPQGVHGLMNSFLRTGPQQLSPEPGAGGAEGVPAPAAAAVGARGLMGAVGQGGAGIYGVLNTYLRTGAAMLSPEPGLVAGIAAPAPEGGAGVVGHGAMRHLPLGAMLTPLPAALHAATPALAVHAAGTPAGGAEAPSSVCSNTCSSNDVGASAAPAHALPGGGASPAAEVHLVLPVHPGSPAGYPEGLPTARPSPTASSEASPPRERDASPGAPSPVTFRLASTSPPADPAKPASNSFSFGIKAADGGASEGEGGTATAPGVGAGPALGRTPSAETIAKPNPFGAMLAHLRQAGPSAPPPPQYASPATMRALLPGSPESPRELTPLHLYSASSGPPSAGTPALGHGSVSRWIDRRGLGAALGTAARADLRTLWAAAGEGGAATAVRAENACLREELAAVEAELCRLGLAHSAALEAADANQRCAEAEVDRARAAAAQMMELAAQIQAMFALCEEEKAGLVADLEAAQEAAAQAGAAVEQSERERAEGEEERQRAAAAVAAAEHSAAEARARGLAAAAELAAIQAHLSGAQRQLAAAAGTALSDTPLAALRQQLKTAHAALAALHAERDGAEAAGAADRPSGVKFVWRSGAPRARLHGDIATTLLEASREHLRRVGALLAEGAEGDVAPEAAEEAVALQENGQLRERLSQARALLPPGSPLLDASPAAGPLHALLSSPVPFAAASPAGAATPSTATTITLDYCQLRQEGGGVGDASVSLSSVGCGEAGGCTPQEEEEERSTVVHNGMVVLNVPASEVSKVQHMVQYWEAVATGEVGGEEEEEGGEQQPSQLPGKLPPGAGLSSPALDQLAAAEAAAPEPSPLRPEQLAAVLPAGWERTPNAAAGTPACPTPLSAAAPPPTREGGPAPAASTPGSLLRAAGHALAALVCPPPSPISAGTPATPASHRSAAATAPAPAATPASLLRGPPGSVGLQEAMRCRLAALKADLAAAQVKLETVDLGLAAIACSPSPGPSMDLSSANEEEDEECSLGGSAGSSEACGSPLCASSSSPPSARSSSQDHPPTPTTAGRGTPASCAAAAASSPDSPPPAAAPVPEPPAAFPARAACAEDENVAANQATPAASRPSVRWAASPRVGSCAKARMPLRTGTPAAALAAAAARRSPAVRSVQSSARPGLRGSPLAAARGGTPLRRMYDLDSSSEEEEDERPTVSASRLGMRVVGGRAGAASPAATPVAHPERPAASPRTGGSSASSSFTPPDPLPLALRALHPLGRLRRGAGLGGGRHAGGALTAAEEREFRRRAAALRIHVSPYFKPRRAGEQ